MFLFTARVRSTTGSYVFTRVCLLTRGEVAPITIPIILPLIPCPFGRGGGRYPISFPQVLTHPVPDGSTPLPQSSTRWGPGGTPPPSGPWGTPYQDLNGVPPIETLMGAPPPQSGLDGWGGVLPPPRPRLDGAWTGYSAGGTPIATGGLSCLQLQRFWKRFRPQSFTVFL